ncbi:hypothetical protein RUM44_009091 [Polyplax serrata]|uniref:Uncharacterized protein n=1 Tax=Polyplax serrata TaxID=468196 RepID=A0ABR1ARR5_POLSC
MIGRIVEFFRPPNKAGWSFSDLVCNMKYHEVQDTIKQGSESFQMQGIWETKGEREDKNKEIEKAETFCHESAPKEKTKRKRPEVAEESRKDPHFLPGHPNSYP